MNAIEAYAEIFQNGQIISVWPSQKKKLDYADAFERLGNELAANSAISSERIRGAVFNNIAAEIREEGSLPSDVEKKLKANQPAAREDKMNKEMPVKSETKKKVCKI